MLFILGIIVGILLSLVVVVVISFFHAPVVDMVEQRYQDIQEHAKSMNYGKTGFVYMPPDEAEEARQEIIEKNKSEGKDTKVADLI